MNWPMSQDYNEAIQNPALAFTDIDLKTGDVSVGPMGFPLPRSGNFADVYHVRGADLRDWAVKCFTRPVVGMDARYAKVSDALARAKLPFTVGFSFLAEGIQVRGVWRPAVKMEWVEGLMLNQVVRENAGRPSVLAALAQLWGKLCRRLREAGIAHADLQHGNVMLVPGARAGVYELKLIDFGNRARGLPASRPHLQDVFARPRPLSPSGRGDCPQGPGDRRPGSLGAVRQRRQPAFFSGRFPGSLRVEVDARALGNRKPRSAGTRWPPGPLMRQIDPTNSLVG
jgi:serine/threonine protein kinase